MRSNKDFNYSNKSIVDEFGRVFFFHDRVFREISINSTDYAIDLMESQLLSELLANNLIPKTKISTEFKNETTSLIIEHDKLIQSLPHEWSFQMLKHAALNVLKVNLICKKHGYQLKDAHSLNILFESTTPKWIDIGSISKAPGNSHRDWVAFPEFLESFVIPLVFWSNNQNLIVRKLLESNFYRMFTIPNQTFKDSDLFNLIFKKQKYRLKINSREIIIVNFNSSLIRFISTIANYIFKKLRIKFKFEQIRDLEYFYPENEIFDFISNLPAPDQDSLWSGYHDKFYNVLGKMTISSRFQRLKEIIESIKDINTIIDLAGNEGVFSILLSEIPHVKNIILVDFDENAIDTAFLNLKKTGNTKVLPLLMNFMFTPNLEDTAERTRSDISIALAVTHHLLLTGNYTVEAVLSRLDLFSRKYVMVEFMPLGLWSVETRKSEPIPEWYNVDWFRAAFSKKFKLILEEQLEENRIVFFGKKDAIL